jgi:NADH:ubiquinone oxidoreductase subunit 3 (subunit A)
LDVDDDVQADCTTMNVTSLFGRILGYTALAVGLSVMILALSMLAATASADSEKLSSYECGFNPFDDARSRFDVRFYLVAILFIVFDIEASFLYPWSMTLSEQGAWGFYAMLDFLFELVVGYVYAWKIGALEWE